MTTTKIDLRKAHYSSPLFYSDRMLEVYLKEGPRHFNIFRFESEFWLQGRFVPGPAHMRRSTADKNMAQKRDLHVAYRIVVKPKA